MPARRREQSQPLRRGCPGPFEPLRLKSPCQCFKAMRLSGVDGVGGVARHLVESSEVGGRRGLYTATAHDASGRLVSVLAQEMLLRPPKPES